VQLTGSTIDLPRNALKEAFMRRSIAVATLLAGFALHAQAQESFDFLLKSRSSASFPLVSEHIPGAAKSPAELPSQILRDELSSRGPRASCETSGLDLCYDMNDRKVVYRPARAYMPQFQGLRAESMSLKRHGIVLKYSFQ
jgi:hypothetical protein